MRRAEFLLLDGHSYVYRAFHAIPSLETRDGFPTNACYGFSTALVGLLRDHRPQYMAVAFDLPGPTFRHRAFPEYKATRPGMPEALVEQLPIIREVTEAAGVAAIECPGYEADDCIGTAARVAADAGIDVTIFTRDKDCLQLVGPRVRVRGPSPKDVPRDAGWVAEHYGGVRPDQLPEVMALAGDSSDNIPGVPGIGLKTAVRLISEFGSLEDVLARLPDVSSKRVREKLSAFSEQARLSGELARIRLDVPVGSSVEEWLVRTPDRERLKELFQRLEFKRLEAQVDELRCP